MIYHPTELMLDDRQREQLQGYDPSFPYTAIDCRFDGYSGPCVDWHWHATLEFNICATGVLRTSTQRGEYIVKEGDGVLVNANVLHRNEAEGGARGVRVQVGDASDPVTLEKAGIKTSPSIIITTHDDDINIYLTIYCRKLRPDVQIITRTNLDRNVHVLHMAGADLVLSLASLVANQIINLLEPGRVFMLNEGLNIFRAAAGVGLAGKNLVNSGIRRNLRCNVVAVKTASGEMLVNPDPQREFQAADELFLIGDAASETAYYETYWPDRGQSGENSGLSASGKRLHEPGEGWFSL